MVLDPVQDFACLWVPVPGQKTRIIQRMLLKAGLSSLVPCKQIKETALDVSLRCFSSHFSEISVCVCTCFIMAVIC